jgi:hypothetical protein
MLKRVTVMLATIAIAFAVGIGLLLTQTRPGAQAAIVAMGVLTVWTLVRVLSRTGDIWRFTAPYE